MTALPAITFGKPESKRLFGIKEWGESYDTDVGWEFTARFFNSPPSVPAAPGDQTVECRIYVRFLKDTASPPDKGYFTYLQGGVTTPTDHIFSLSGETTVTDADYAAFSARGSAVAPLWNSLDVKDAAGNVTNPAHQIYWPVNGHELRVSIKQLTPWNASATPPTADTVTFWDDITKTPITSPTLNVTTKSETINGSPVEGVARFYIRGTNLVQFAKEITFAVEDLSIK